MGNQSSYNFYNNLFPKFCNKWYFSITVYCIYRYIRNTHYLHETKNGKFSVKWKSSFECRLLIILIRNDIYIFFVLCRCRSRCELGLRCLTFLDSFVFILLPFAFFLFSCFFVFVFFCTSIYFAIFLCRYMQEKYFFDIEIAIFSLFIHIHTNTFHLHQS